LGPCEATARSRRALSCGLPERIFKIICSNDGSLEGRIICFDERYEILFYSKWNMAA
jgi:hypothetical protein